MRLLVVKVAVVVVIVAGIEVVVAVAADIAIVAVVELLLGSIEPVEAHIDIVVVGSDGTHIDIVVVVRSVDAHIDIVEVVVGIVVSLIKNSETYLKKKIRIIEDKVQQDDSKRIIKAIYQNCPKLKYLINLLINCQYLNGLFYLFIRIYEWEFDWSKLFELSYH
ncbi:hypothetical protein C1645_823810 [Glomus cerebriforme]|uniref:Uncharacterized protein n=1 Tax=Glomus cerebriforme TaxID=658196 RepID=A0A397SYL7_9GLOM|nr:hypothetical protein C1645_823810 [Glomus cerebriforme]